MKRVLVLLLLISVATISVWHYRSIRSQCIPIYGSWFRHGDYQAVAKITAAMGSIQKSSPEDYQRLCSLSAYIRLIDFENSSLPLPDNTLGAYQWVTENPRVNGTILISRRVTKNSSSALEAVLVHEACHANQDAKGREADELECQERARNYLPKKPAMSLSELSASLIQQSGYENHGHCRTSKSFGKYQTQGSCVFINNTLQNEHLCATVFLTYAGEKIKDKQVCADLDPVAYKEVLFTLNDFTPRPEPKQNKPARINAPDWPYAFGFDWQK